MLLQNAFSPLPSPSSQPENSSIFLRNAFAPLRSTSTQSANPPPALKQPTLSRAASDLLASGISAPTLLGAAVSFSFNPFSDPSSTLRPFAPRCLPWLFSPPAFLTGDTPLSPHQQHPLTPPNPQKYESLSLLRTATQHTSTQRQTLLDTCSSTKGPLQHQHQEQASQNISRAASFSRPRPVGSGGIAGKEVEVREVEQRLERMEGEERGLRRDVSFFLLLFSLVSSFEVSSFGFSFTRL